MRDETSSLRNIHSHATDAFRTDRARPLLGTLVKIGVTDPDEDRAQAAVEQAFGSIEALHALMSFHNAHSDVSRLNRYASIAPVAVHRHTAAVIRLSLDISAASEGTFDITIAPLLVQSGLLPAPQGAPAADPRASWRDIEFVDDRHIRFRRPLWIDLGGIAKGYAVDTASEQLSLAEVTQCHVNAGGDLRIEGPMSERVLLQVPDHPPDELPMIELASGSIASSSRLLSLQRGARTPEQPHIHGVQRCPIGRDRFVAVLATRCVIADALTKVVLAEGAAAAATLRAFEAQALLFEQRHGWRTFGYEH